MLVNLALSLLLPDEVLFFPAWVVPLLGVLLLTPLVVFNPRRLTRETTWSRWLSTGLAVLLTVANQLTVVKTIDQLLHGHPDGGAVLLTAPAGVGEQHHRVRARVLGARPRWPRRAAATAALGERRGRLPVPPGVRSHQGLVAPVYLDYLYVAMTNMVAFSPTDTMPLTCGRR